MNAKKGESQENVSPRLTEIEKLEHRFSDVKDSTIMEELMATIKEYITERENGNGTG